MSDGGSIPPGSNRCSPESDRELRRIYHLAQEIEVFEVNGQLTSQEILDILKISKNRLHAMTTPANANQIAFRYRATDSATGVTRKTAKRLAEQLGVDETQAIHMALHEMAMKLLPQYEADDGPLTAKQVQQIKKHAPQGKKRSVRSSLFELDAETA